MEQFYFKGVLTDLFEQETILSYNFVCSSELRCCMCFDFFTPGMMSSGHAPGHVTYFEKKC